MSDDANSGDDLYTPAQYREHADGYGARDALGHEYSGIVQDPKVSRFLAVLSNHYDPTDAEDTEDMPGRWADLDEVQDIVSIAATERGRDAMEDGDMQMLKHLTGQTDQRADVSGLKAIETLKSFMTGPAPMFYEWAEPGTGKTNFALLLAELWKREHDGQALVASNIRTLRETDAWSTKGDLATDESGDLVVVDEDGTTLDDAEPRGGWLSNFGELEEWLQQDGDPMNNAQTPKLFIFDEASSSAGGSGSSGYETKSKMGPLAYKIRKYGGSLIVIGHDGKDVHPLIREMGVCVHKSGLKTATFYEDVKNRRGKGEIESIEGIPETDWRYDDKEPTAWSWSRGDEEEDMAPKERDRLYRIAFAIKLRDDGVSVADTANYVDRSAGWVSERYSEFQDGEHIDAVKFFEGETA
ncbi:hypothetical protein J2752_001964 [Halarchaeum rubridurum]|uniref:Uncharacterized protein n=1 Tax=Halarchaeum rubridurum TaxID=489911 RepID=A0A830G0I8_9EURY|nr:hypothetical protein [Halarchaeum rubridurum]MBP1955052.1 hypothetical protein [Halarchaeum rubridurum]GGM69324.1 hypothetical protein GCM10009017_19410 [Halarchaeum rubridurum]